MKAFIISILIVLTFTGWSQDEQSNLEKYLDKEIIQQIMKEKEIFNILREGELPRAMPRISADASIINNIKKLKPSIGIEILSFYPYTASQKIAKDKELSIYNVLGSISSLKDIQYYSASRKRMRIFYHDAFIVKSEKSTTPLDDIKVLKIPQQRKLTAYFKDSSFGNYYSDIFYQYDGEMINMQMQNLSQIWYFIVPILEPGGMVSSVTLIPTEEGIVFYGLSYLKILNLFGLAEDRIDSLYNSMKAVYSWFAKELEKQIP